MTRKSTLVVVGIIAADDTEEAELPADLNDLEELTAYELGIRLRVGRGIPERVLILVASPDELTEIIEGIEGVEVNLELMTDDQNQPQPETLDDLWELLSKSVGGAAPPPEDDSDNPFRIL